MGLLLAATLSSAVLATEIPPVTPRQAPPLPVGEIFLISGSKSRVFFILPGTLKRDGSKAEVSLYSVGESPPGWAGPPIPQVIQHMRFDCKAALQTPLEAYWYDEANQFQLRLPEGRLRPVPRDATMFKVVCDGLEVPAGNRFSVSGYEDARRIADRALASQ